MLTSISSAWLSVFGSETGSVARGDSTELPSLTTLFDRREVGMVWCLVSASQRPQTLWRERIWGGPGARIQRQRFAFMGIRVRLEIGADSVR